VVVSLGLDGAEHDPAAPLRISREGFAEAGRRIGALGLPTVFVQEGGYDLTRLVGLVLAVLMGFESA
jgi:acetoin utilization deacetylase AcuC-like enzyme